MLGAVLEEINGWAGEEGVVEPVLFGEGTGEEVLVLLVLETFEFERRRDAAPKRAGRLSVLRECML